MTSRKRPNGSESPSTAGVRSRPRTKLPAHERFAGLPRDAVVSRVCSAFCSGIPLAQLMNHVNKELRTRLKREDPTRLLQYAAEQKWLHFVQPPDQELSDKLHNKFPLLQEVCVVRTRAIEDVAYRATMRLFFLLARAGSTSADGVVRVGFGGGRVLRLVAHRFSQFLSSPRSMQDRVPLEQLPGTVEFQAMVGGNVEGSWSNPNSFFQYLLQAADDGSTRKVRTPVVGLPAPEVVGTAKSSSEFEALKGIRSIMDIRDGWKSLGTVVSSAGDWGDVTHNRYRSALLHHAKRLEKASNRKGQLTKKIHDLDPRKLVGDFLWFPVDAQGREFPLSDKLGFRTMTLLDRLDQVRELIKNGTKVLLVIAPCSTCGRLKTDVVRAVLSAELATHIVVDSATARSLLET